MAFKVTDPDDLAALKAEVADDPLGMEYAAFVDTSTSELLRLLNDPAANVGGESINRPTEELDIPEIAGVIDNGEFDALSAYDKVWVTMFINQPPEVRLKPFQTKFVQAFPASSITLTAALALRSKPASRGEILFGVNTVISGTDWATARDS